MALLAGLFLSTFILEDVALASALAFISQGKIGFWEAFWACSLGIGVGDLGLYVLGRWTSKISYLKKKTSSKSFREFLERLKSDGNMDFAIVVSRAVPGTRFPTYLASGLTRYSLSRFIFLTVASVGLWVFFTLYFGHAFFSFFKEQWILALLLFIGLFALLKKGFRYAKNPWDFKAALHSWRRWLHFEFWPAWFFYLPVIFYYIFLSVRYRSPLVPFYASPHLKHGGLIGESKWDFLKYLDPQAASTLPSFVLAKELSLADARHRVLTSGTDFPFVMKPDVGQRGFGVRVIKNELDFSDYWNLNQGDVIVQKKSRFAQEAGVFYIRPPRETRGFLFSITDKDFPFVVGDGKTRIGDLILQNSRARIMASTYLSRHQENLERKLAVGEKYLLSECGNHCQGALFFNGNHLATDDLLAAVEKVVGQIPDYYFGRIDIRYQDKEFLKKGLRFEIIELNGAGSEATHIWDPQTPLHEAYRVLFTQWRYLFAVGAEVKKQGGTRKSSVINFLSDCFKVYFRKGPLTTSS